MDPKLRFGLFFSVVFTLFFIVASFIVYSQFKNNIIASAENSLTAHLEHDWHHIEENSDLVRHDWGSLDTKDVYSAVWRDGELVYDSYPKEERNSQRDKIVKRIERTHNERQYVLEGYFDLHPINENLSTLRRVLLLGCFFCGACRYSSKLAIYQNSAASI